MTLFQQESSLAFAAPYADDQQRPDPVFARAPSVKAVPKLWKSVPRRMNVLGHMLPQVF